MKLIRLNNTQNEFAFVDDEDFEALNQLKWNLFLTNRKRYVMNSKTVNAKTIRMLMHRLIMNAKPCQSVSHKDGNSLNNTKENLIIHDGREYRKRNKLYKNNETGFRGVYARQCIRGTKYEARIKHEGKMQYLGTFDEIAKAAEVVEDFLAKQNNIQ